MFSTGYDDGVGEAFWSYARDVDFNREGLENGIRFGSTRGKAFVISHDAGDFINLFDNESPHPLQRAIMPVLLRRGETYEVAGTAFAIAYEIYLTAKHVVAENGRARMEEARLLYVGGRKSDGSFMGGPLPVVKVVFSESIDIALLWARFPISEDPDLALSLLPVSFQPPKIGDTCLAIGYTAGMTLDADDLGQDQMTIAPRLHASKGQVEDVFLHHRDRSMLPFPCFQTSARFDHQMSGSPVFSGGVGQQRVTGVVTSGYEYLDEAGHTGFASLLWAAAGLALDVQHADRTVRPTNMLEIVTSHGSADGAEMVEVQNDKIRLRLGGRSR